MFPLLMKEKKASSRQVQVSPRVLYISRKVDKFNPMGNTFECATQVWECWGENPNNASDIIDHVSDEVITLENKHWGCYVNRRVYIRPCCLFLTCSSFIACQLATQSLFSRKRSSRFCIVFFSTTIIIQINRFLEEKFFNFFLFILFNFFGFFTFFFLFHTPNALNYFQNFLLPFQSFYFVTSVHNSVNFLYNWICSFLQFSVEVSFVSGARVALAFLFNFSIFIWSSFKFSDIATVCCLASNRYSTQGEIIIYFIYFINMVMNNCINCAWRHP